MTQELAGFEITRAGDTLNVAGELRIGRGAELFRAVRAALADGVEVLDLGGVTAADGSAIALIVELAAEQRARGMRCEVVTGDERVKALVALFTAERPAAVKRRRPESAIAQVGRVTVERAGELKNILAFFGELVAAVVKLVRSPRTGHWKEVPPLIERTGADAITIVALINFLVGFVMAYQSAKQLKMFGANIYVADLVGISMTRELAPLMTAIIICGRSGAAFAAEIGSMKVSEEIDALRTLGLAPFGWLVVPRVVALVLVTPVLTIMADVVGVLGGLAVGVTSLDLTVHGYIKETETAIFAWDVWTGLIKSVAFAIAITLIACQQGFAASGGAEGVGRRTTATVVTSLFALVLLDAMFTVVFRRLDL